jgi:hypothetical protein
MVTRVMAIFYARFYLGGEKFCYEKNYNLRYHRPCVDGILQYVADNKLMES